MLIKYFVTGQGDKIPCVTREQIIEIDRIAENETGPNLWQMMENAGRNLMEFICKSLGTNWHKREILVLAGKGNNGGGGICAARHLINHGGNVKLAVADMERLNEAPFYQRQIYENSGGKSYPFEEAKLLEPDIIIDAILGYNLKGPPKGVTNEMIQWANSKKAEIISLDIPSGVDSTTGEKTGNYIKPDCSTAEQENFTLRM